MILVKTVTHIRRESAYVGLQFSLGLAQNSHFSTFRVGQSEVSDDCFSNHSWEGKSMKLRAGKAEDHRISRLIVGFAYNVNNVLLPLWKEDIIDRVYREIYSRLSEEGYGFCFPT